MRARNKAHRAGNLTVRAEDLAPYIRQWIDSGRTLEALSEKSGASTKLMRTVLQGGQAWVTDVKADAILVAMGLPHVMNRIRVAPPPSKFYEE